MTLLSLKFRARVGQLTIKPSGDDVVVSFPLSFPLSRLGADELEALAHYVDSDIDAELTVPYAKQAYGNGKLPLDEELERVEVDERVRPGADETCLDCGTLIGEDPNAGFHTPPAGPPSPLCGTCYQTREDAETAREDGGATAETDTTDPANQSWCEAGEHWVADPVGSTCEQHAMLVGSVTVEKADWRKIADGDDDGLEAADPLANLTDGSDERGVVEGSERSEIVGTAPALEDMELTERDRELRDRESSTAVLDAETTDAPRSRRR